MVNFPDITWLGSNFGSDHRFLLHTPRNQNHEYLLKLFSLAKQLDNIDPKLLRCVERILNVQRPEQSIYEEVKGLLEKNQLQPAIEKAKAAQEEEGYFEVIWQVCEIIHGNNLTDELTLIDLYQAISPANPNFKEANERLVILYSPELYPGHDEYFYLEKKLDAAIKSGNSRITAQIFHRLCGYSGLTPTIPEIKGSTESLIAIAQHIRALNTTIAAQQLTISSQAQELGTLKPDSKPYQPKMF